jgi:hypothetical protein
VTIRSVGIDFYQGQHGVRCLDDQAQPYCWLLKAKMQKVATLRRYLRGPVKSDRIDALTLAKMPFVDPEQMEEVYLPLTDIHILQYVRAQEPPYF